MLRPLFHAWERRLAAVTKDRVVRPFDWGLDWIPTNGHAPGAPAERIVADWVAHVMADTDALYTPQPTTDYVVRPAAEGQHLTFPSALTTPHAENNIVHGRLFPARQSRDTRGTRRAAVLVLPQWNANAGGHVGLSKLLAWSGMSALRL